MPKKGVNSYGQGAINELRYLSYKRTHETAFIPPPPAPLQHSYNITYNQSNYNVHLNHPVPTSESHQAVNASFQFPVANSQLLTTQIYINLPHYPPPIPTSVPANYQIPPPPPPQLAIPPPPESCLSPSRTRTASPAASVQSFEYQPLTPCERKVHLVPTGMGRRETPVGGGGRGGWTGRQI